MERHISPETRRSQVALEGSYKRGWFIWGALGIGGFNVGILAAIVDLRTAALVSIINIGAPALAQVREYTVQAANRVKLQSLGFEVKRKLFRTKITKGNYAGEEVSLLND